MMYGGVISLRRRKMKKIAGLAAVLLFFCSSVYAEEPVQYTNETFARLSYINGNIYIQRASDLDYEEGIVNMPITEGDRLGTTDGRAEIYMNRGKYLRMDHNTKLDFLNLPKQGDDLTQVQIWTGNIYFHVLSLKREKTIELHTSDISLYILDEGLYRIDVRQDETEVFVFRGLLEAAGETGSVLVKEAQRLEAVRGHFIDQPSGFAAAAEDSFDRWSEYRDIQVRKRMANRYLPEELEDFEYELAAYGEWANVPPYGHVWVPGGIERDWHPYWHGRWIWLPMSGWTWLPYEPWGWVTSHFGRWHWSAGLGWYWIPTRMWGPGWVHWYWGYDYIGWVPISYWGYPGVIINDNYYGRHSGQYYPHESRALTVIHKNQLSSRNVSKVAMSRNTLKNIGAINLVKNQPAIRPNSSKISVDAIRKGKSPGKTASQVSKSKIPTKITPYGLKEAGTTETRKILKKTKSSRSTVGRIYDLLSGSKTKITKSGSSTGSSSRAIKTSSKSRSSSKVKKSSSSRSRSSSNKVKKKK
jgi:hypothetical protein